MKKINWFLLISIVFVTQSAGILGALLSDNSWHTYNMLIKPPLAPPGWLFGVVWPILYLLMAVAVYFVYESAPQSMKKEAIILYWVQLFVNFLWPIVFFRFELLWASVGILLLLDILVIFTMIWFYLIERKSGYLMVPYLLWIIFASYLNIAVALLN